MVRDCGMEGIHREHDAMTMQVPAFLDVVPQLHWGQPGVFSSEHKPESISFGPWIAPC